MTDAQNTHTCCTQLALRFVYTALLETTVAYCIVSRTFQSQYNYVLYLLPVSANSLVVQSNYYSFDHKFLCCSSIHHVSVSDGHQLRHPVPLSSCVSQCLCRLIRYSTSHST